MILILRILEWMILPDIRAVYFFGFRLFTSDLDLTQEGGSKSLFNQSSEILDKFYIKTIATKKNPQLSEMQLLQFFQTNRK